MLPQWGIIISLSEWLKLKTVRVPNAGKDAEKLDHSSTAAGEMVQPLWKIVWWFLTKKHMHRDWWARAKLGKMKTETAEWQLNILRVVVRCSGLHVAFWETLDLSVWILKVACESVSQVFFVFFFTKQETDQKITVWVAYAQPCKPLYGHTQFGRSFYLPDFSSHKWTQATPLDQRNWDSESSWRSQP